MAEPLQDVNAGGGADWVAALELRKGRTADDYQAWMDPTVASQTVDHYKHTTAHVGRDRVTGSYMVHKLQLDGSTTIRMHAPRHLRDHLHEAASNARPEDSAAQASLNAAVTPPVYRVTGSVSLMGVHLPSRAAVGLHGGARRTDTAARPADEDAFTAAGQGEAADDAALPSPLTIDHTIRLHASTVTLHSHDYGRRASSSSDSSTSTVLHPQALLGALSADMQRYKIKSRDDTVLSLDELLECLAGSDGEEEEDPERAFARADPSRPSQPFYSDFE